MDTRYRAIEDPEKVFQTEAVSIGASGIVAR